MHRFIRGAWLAPILLGPLLATAWHGAPPRHQDPQDPTTAPFPRAGRYLGKEVCKDCHGEQWDLLEEGHHGDLIHTDGLRGCETCHGPGAAHGDDEDNEPLLITHPRALAPAAQTRICLQCHRDQIAGHGGDPAGFVMAGKGCTSCHGVHQARAEAPYPDLRFAGRGALDAHADNAAVGAAGCVTCHPQRDRLLQVSHHRSLAADADASGCEGCHGHGGLHAESGGLGRLISRPDRAKDGIATCRGCHAEVDAATFHWTADDHPLLSTGLRCTTCHRVHEPSDPALRPAAGGVDPQTGERLGGAAPTNRLCVTCHAPAFEVLHGTIHESLAPLDTPLALGCGGCHAGAEQHARRGGLARLVDSLHGSDARHQLQTCSQCHSEEHALRHVRTGAHHRHEVSCLSCHSPAAPRGRVQHDAESKCASCHQEVAAQFRQPNHHPVPEGHMGCSDCHEPHGARRKIRDRQLTEQACVACHREYRGPYLFSHQASRSDGCVACHVPHGSANQRLLTHATTQQQCLQCHADFPAFHDQSSGAVFTHCLNCHTQVHGSNHSRYLFR